MTAGYHIRYLLHQDIDLAKWDACVEKASNGTVYGWSLFLDHMTAGSWDGLVWGDYEAVMPLTHRKKWGVRYLYQPPLSPQLGVFSQAPITAEMVGAFLQEAERHFRFAEIFLNYANGLPGLQPFTNYILQLHPAYEELQRGYKKDLQKNLKRAAGFDLQYGPAKDIDQAIGLYRQLVADRTPHVKETDYTNFTGFCRAALIMEPQSVILRAVSAHSPQPLATALLLNRNNRLYFLLSACTPEGRKMEANHFLLDRLIKEFAGTGKILDFDGSEIPGIAHFYRNFGGIDQPIYFYRRNKLIWPLRYFK